MTDREDCMFKAAHLAGAMEQEKIITVEDWDELHKVVSNAVDIYLDSEDADFWIIVETALRRNFSEEAKESCENCGLNKTSKCPWEGTYHHMGEHGEKIGVCNGWKPKIA